MEFERRYTRIDTVRELVDGIIKEIEDKEEQRCAYVHLYGVGLMAALIALKRGHSRETAELAEIAGMMHDLLAYADGSAAGAQHAHKCAVFARDEILGRLDCFSDEDKMLIYNGIYNHSDKDVHGFWFDEIIKDADATQHALRNPVEDHFYMSERVQELLRELL